MDVLINTLHTAGYVGSLFVLPSARTGGNRKDPATGLPITRDTPHVIRARMVGVGLSSLASLYAVSVLVSRKEGVSQSISTAELLGLYKYNITSKDALRLLTCPLLCTASLFLGPLFTTGLDHRLPGMSAFSWRLDVVGRFSRLQGWRNYVIGPITEELVFRSALIATAFLAGRSRRHLIWVTPLYFGIAHAHHAYQVFVNNGRTRQALQRGVLSALFQFTYTSLFGFHAAFLYLRTSSVIPPLLSHIFCNFMGFPDISSALYEHPSKKILIIGAYITGIGAFAKLLMPLTSPSLFGGSIFWQ